MIKKLLLAVLCVLAIASCHKEEESPQPICLCVTYNHFLYLGLTDASGSQNLVYGPGATLVKDSISFWSEETRIGWRSIDSTTAKGKIQLDIRAVPNDTTIPASSTPRSVKRVTMKVNTPAGLTSMLLTIYSEHGCCESTVTGVFVDKSSTAIKPDSGAIKIPFSAR